MKYKSFLARPYASIVYNQVKKGIYTALADQQSTLQMLVRSAAGTAFSQDHHLSAVRTYEDFKESVPLRDYEAFKPYIDRIKAGEQNVLWRGKPMYLAKTSGTTSGAKYIPISKESIAHHINGARNALLCYMIETGNTAFADGRMIFLSGSPEMERIGGIPTGRLSGIVNHFVPGYLRSNQLPSYETNCIEDWENKLERIVAETLHEDMTLISGIPPWMQMYFDRLLEKSKAKNIKELFPNLQVIVHGGVNFEPYSEKLKLSLGGHVDMIETYPASEGFFAFQDRVGQEGLLLNTYAGIFYEFIPAHTFNDPNPTRLSLAEVKTGENYAMVVSTNAGLWGYNVGDTVKFVSTNPYRLVVTGRVKHFISAFGEHVIAEEVDYALSMAAKELGISVVEFTVAPMVQPHSGKPYHEWFIEFSPTSAPISALAAKIDHYMCQKNIYYNDLISGGILQPLHITPIKQGGFVQYMKSIGKLGGQNKLPRLANNRAIADALQAWVVR
ncbi:MAG: hypothetical protein EBX41_07820 [Chitinophagia bacterium]|nr:hypothetical protein [Chitinophagia bacterium]